MVRQNREQAMQFDTLDVEWIELIKIARALGISKETVKDFFKTISGNQAHAEE